MGRLLLVNGLSFGLVEPGVSTADEIFETLLRHRPHSISREPLLSMQSGQFLRHPEALASDDLRQRRLGLVPLLLAGKGKSADRTLRNTARR